MNINRIKGIVPAMVTPMFEDETINYEEVSVQVERLLSAGVHGIFVSGTNGEGFALNSSEKKSILRVVLKSVADRVPVYAGTGCVTTRDTINECLDAVEVGTNVLSIITPYFALASQKELYNHYRLIAESVPNTPIILYNIPQRTGNKLLPETVESLAIDYKNIVGIKDSSGDFSTLIDFLYISRKLQNKFSVFSGNDALILPLLKEGGAGGVTGCANVYPKTMVTIYDQFIKGNLDAAQAAQDIISDFRDLFCHGNANTIIKESVRLMGENVGPCRRPFNLIDEPGIQAIKDKLEKNSKAGIQ